jgi:hypothetical protein
MLAVEVSRDAKVPRRLVETFELLICTSVQDRGTKATLVKHPHIQKL